MNKPMNKNELISRLRTEASTNPAANAVFHMWALRLRARFTVTIGSLSAKMRAEGFHYTNGDYANLLKFLAGLGFGTLDVSPTGRIKALKDINITLQSIGKAACGGNNELFSYRPRNHFKNLVVRHTTRPPLIAVIERPQALQPQYTWLELLKLLVILPIQKMMFKFKQFSHH